MYAGGSTQDAIYQYTLSTAWDLSTASYASKSLSVASEDTNPRGIFFKPDGSVLFVSGINDDEVLQYSLSTSWDLATGTFDNISFSVQSQDPQPHDVHFSTDGSKMYIVGDTYNSVYQYSTSVELTAGEKYYVQNDGTLSTTAGTPSVLAGTAISATKLVVKT
jgi:6-phosphogluconolactonase (cycloisomerase 2 family)